MEDDDLKVGDDVELSGLSNDAYNWRVGTVVAPRNEQGRYPVRLSRSRGSALDDDAGVIGVSDRTSGS